MQCAVVSVALFHLLLPLFVHIDIHTCLLGFAIHVLYYLILEDFPNLELGWSMVVSLIGNRCRHLAKIFCLLTRSGMLQGFW